MCYLFFQSVAFTVRESTFRKGEGQLWEVGCLFKYTELLKFNLLHVRAHISVSAYNETMLGIGL